MWNLWGFRSYTLKVEFIKRHLRSRCPAEINISPTIGGVDPTSNTHQQNSKGQPGAPTTGTSKLEPLQEYTVCQHSPVYPALYWQMESWELLQPAWAPSHIGWQLDEEHKDVGPSNSQPLTQGLQSPQINTKNENSPMSIVLITSVERNPLFVI